MSRALLVASVAMASYAVFSTIGSAGVAALWRAGLIDRDRPGAAWRARRLAWLRAIPSVMGAGITAAIVIPGYLKFEPTGGYEEVGIVLRAFALAGAGLLLAGAAIAVRAAVLTWRLERDWLRLASPLDLTPPPGVPAFVIESRAPVVALVGVFSPKLVAARSVIDACSVDELVSIIAHERGHLLAKDNLKRWLIACAPDALRWTPVHQAIAAAWYDTAEDAADDIATAGALTARADLAALLVKIARMAAPMPMTTAMVSPFVEAGSLDRRVRRLLQDEPGAQHSLWPAIFRLAALAATLMLLVLPFSPAALRAVHEIVEAVVALGR